MFQNREISLKISGLKCRNSLLLVLLFFLLQASFSLVIKDLYVFQKASVTGGFLYEFNGIRFFVGLVVSLSFIFLTLLFRIRGFLYIVLILILIFFVFPSAILFANVGAIDNRILLSHGILFLSVLGIGLIKLKLPSQTFGINTSRKILLGIVVVGMLPFIILYTPYINFKNLLFLEIYETRAMMTAKVNTFYTNYTYSWFNKILIPSLVVFGLYFRKKKTILISIFSLVFLFLCGAHKAVFIGIFIILIFYKYDYEKKANYFIKFILLTAFGALFASLFFDYNYLMVMSIRRTIFLPGLLDVLYYDFFDDNHLYWSGSFAKYFIEYPFELQHYYVIGEKYFDSKQWAANNGIISDGFMNFGMVGVTINAIVVGIYFSILNQLNISGKFFGLIFLFVFSLISSSLTTVLLTHGGIVLLLLALFVLRDTKNQML